MRIAIALSLLAISGCSPAPPAAVAPPSPAVQTARSEVERSAVERFGQAALARARSADEFVAALRYPGLPMPPYDTDGKPITPVFPTALLYREKGQWFAYGMGGAHPVLPRWSQQLEAVLRNPGLYAEPADGGLVGCTDAGASYVWMQVKGRPEQARIGHCGGSPLTEQLVSAALMG
jgi:hypothetical protein